MFIIAVISQARIKLFYCGESHQSSARCVGSLSGLRSLSLFNNVPILPAACNPNILEFNNCADVGDIEIYEPFDDGWAVGE